MWCVGVGPQGGHANTRRVRFHPYLVTAEDGIQVCRSGLRNRGLTSSPATPKAKEWARETQNVSECFRVMRESLNVSREVAIATQTMAAAGASATSVAAVEAVVLKAGKKRIADRGAQKMSRSRRR